MTPLAYEARQVLVLLPQIGANLMNDQFFHSQGRSHHLLAVSASFESSPKIANQRCNTNHRILKASEENGPDS